MDSRDFNSGHAFYLTQNLGKVSFPSLSDTEKNSLMSLIDSVIQVEKHHGSLDENGNRYLLSMKMLNFCEKTSPMEEVTELNTRDIAWAYFSDSQDALFDLCNSSFENKLIWSQVKAMGMAVWLKSPTSLVV